MSWLLGLLGGPWGWLVTAARAAGGWLGAACGWALRHPAWAVAIAAALVAAWEWHEASTVKRDLTVAQANYAATIGRQNAAIAQWQAEGQRRQAQAATALATIRQANRPLLTVADQIEHTAPAAQVQADCHTAPEVMAKKEQM